MLVRALWRVALLVTVIVSGYVGLLHLRPYQPPRGLPLYLPDMTCDPPCLLGAQPGVMPMHRAVAALAGHPNIAHASREELPLSALWEWDQFAARASALGLSYGYGVTPHGPVYGYSPDDPTEPVYYLRSLSFTLPVELSAADFVLALPPEHAQRFTFSPGQFSGGRTSLQIVYEVTCQPDESLAVALRLRERGDTLVLYKGTSEAGVCAAG